MPGASSMRGVTGFRVLDALNGALAQLIPDRIPAAGEGGNTLAIFGADRPERRRPVHLLRARRRHLGRDADLGRQRRAHESRQPGCEYPDRGGRVGVPDRDRALRARARHGRPRRVPRRPRDRARLALPDAEHVADRPLRPRRPAPVRPLRRQFRRNVEQSAPAARRHGGDAAGDVLDHDRGGRRLRPPHGRRRRLGRPARARPGRGRPGRGEREGEHRRCAGALRRRDRASTARVDARGDGRSTRREEKRRDRQGRRRRDRRGDHGSEHGALPDQARVRQGRPRREAEDLRRLDAVLGRPRAAALLERGRDQARRPRARRCSRTPRRSSAAPPGSTQIGYMLFAPPEGEQALRDIVPVQQGFGVETDAPRAGRGREPLAASSGSTGVALACHEPTSGFANPVQTVESLVRSAAARGPSRLRRLRGARHLDRRTGASRASSRVTGEIATGVVVNACGPWGDRIGRMVGIDYPITFSREHEAIFDAPEGFQDFPVISDVPQRLYCRPYVGGKVLVGDGWPKEKEPVDPETYDDGTDDAHVSKMVPRLAEPPAGARGHADAAELRRRVRDRLLGRLRHHRGLVPDRRRGGGRRLLLLLRRQRPRLQDRPGDRRVPRCRDRRAGAADRHLGPLGRAVLRGPHVRLRLGAGNRA